MSAAEPGQFFFEGLDFPFRLYERLGERAAPAALTDKVDEVPQSSLFRDELRFLEANRLGDTAIEVCESTEPAVKINRLVGGIRPTNGRNPPTDLILSHGARSPCFLDSGELARVPREALPAGHSPILTITSKRPLMVARISSDPYVPVNKARQLAADFDLHVNF